MGRFEASPGDSIVAHEIRRLRATHAEPVFSLVDSDHSKNHVLSELHLLRNITRPGDYVVVEDGKLDCHPVLPDYGAGLYEALQEYLSKYSEDYKHHAESENNFGAVLEAKPALKLKRIPIPIAWANSSQDFY